MSRLFVDEWTSSQQEEHEVGCIFIHLVTVGDSSTVVQGAIEYPFVGEKILIP